ncbi:hypothetical protein TM7_0122 [candidate division TM7 genomosp. GTL1]|nr:hypothetical protein TM7_0122 [candidate division TM7 genomosp. GTL1]
MQSVCRYCIFPVIIIYGLSIFGNNFKSYVGLGELVAVNGRYFIPLMPLIFVVIGLAYRQWLTGRPSAMKIKAVSVIVAFVMLVQGGGLLTFLIRSERNWYWPNPTVISVNELAQRAARAFVLLK